MNRLTTKQDWTASASFGMSRTRGGKEMTTSVHPTPKGWMVLVLVMPEDHESRSPLHRALADMPKMIGFRKKLVSALLLAEFYIAAWDAGVDEPAVPDEVDE